MDKDGLPARWLLVSDIDDTLTGDRAALDGLWDAVCKAAPPLKFALNSSRPSASVDETIADYFPASFAPDAIITGLGTQIRVKGDWLEDWSARFADWPRDEIAARVLAMGFEPHPPQFQTPGKASFAVPGKEAYALVLAELQRNHLPFQALFSGESDLDLLAPGAGKDAASRYLAEFYGIAPDRIIAAGDSGNDLAMFKAAGRAIAVGNARRELIDAMPVEKTYLAKSHHAAGVHEGLIELGILPPMGSAMTQDTTTENKRVLF